MPIYAVRLNNGSCLIGEADSESDARENFQDRWDCSVVEPQQDLILSVREIPRNVFLTRWWPSTVPDDENAPLGDLEGYINDASNVHEHEYPMINASHLEAFKMMADSTDNGPVLPFLENWERQSNKSLQEAVSAEMNRGTIQSKNAH